MATQDLEKLVVQLSADIKKYENAINRAQNVTNTQFKAIEKRAVDMNKNLSGSFSGLGSTVAKSLAIIGGLAGFQSLSDSATKIDNALKVAGLSGDALNDTFDKLYASAQKNHAPLDALVQLYSRVSLNQKSLGASSEDLINFSDNVGKALRVSGTSAEEAQGSLLQLSQALGSGTVHAEEFNSIVEGMPAFAIAAAKGIKQASGSVAELKNLVNNGSLSSRALFDGFIAGASDLDEKVAGANTTIAQSIGDLRNALTKAVRSFNDSTDAAGKAVEAIEYAVGVLNNANFDNFAEQINQAVDGINLLVGGLASTVGWLRQISTFGANGKPLVNLGAGNAITDPLNGRTFEQAAYLRDSANLQQDADAKHLAALEDQYKQQKNIRALLPGGGNNQDEQANADADILNQIDTLRDKASKAKDEVVSLDAATAKLLSKDNLPVQGPIDPRKVQGPVQPKVTPPPKIDITDEKYKTTGTKKAGKTKSGGADAKAYDHETRQVKERTDVLNAQSAAQAKLNPYVNDYGYAAEKAATAQELLTASQRSGNAAGKELRDVSQLLSGDFSKLTPEARAQAEAMLALAEANGYAVQKNNQLNDAQDKLRQTMEDWRATSKDAAEGFTKDLIQGKSAVEALGGALEKIGDKLLDSAFDGLFGTSGTNNWFSSLWSSIGLKGGGAVKLAGGGSVRGAGGPRDDKIPAMLSNGEFVVNAAATKKNRALLEAINSGHVLRRADGGIASAPRFPTPSRVASVAGRGSDAVHITYAPVIDNRGADIAAVARLQQQMDKDRAEFSARVVNTIRTAKKTRQQGI